MSNSRKYTNDQIKKALEVCSTPGMPCHECPFSEDCDGCELLPRMALDIIRELEERVVLLENAAERQEAAIARRDGIIDELEEVIENAEV